MKNIALNIKKCRELHGVTREFIADELGMSVSGYSKIERGEIDVTISKLKKISQILEVDLNDILFFNNQNYLKKGNEEIQNKGQNEIYKNYISLLEKEIKRLNDLLLNQNLE